VTAAGEGPRFGYACGALRVTLDETSESVGPRAHVSGFLGGLEACGVAVRRYLAGEDAPRRAASPGSERRISGGFPRRLATDTARLALRAEVRRRARRAIGDVDVLYERQATFHDVGRPFQRRGSCWVLESNGPFWYEAGVERRSLALRGLARRLELTAYRDADLVVAVSDALKEIIVAESGRAAEDVFVLPNATDCRRFDPARATPRRLAAGPVVGWVGYMTQWAGLEELIAAAATLRRSGRDIDIVLIGDGPDRARLELLAAQTRVSDLVRFVGNVPWGRVPDLMAGFDVGFSGQRQMRIGAMYHSPQKLYEYQAMGLPVVASDYPDARRLAFDGRCGWLYPAGDVAALEGALGRALAVDAGDRAQRGALARTNVLVEHSWERRVGTLLAELERRGMMEHRVTAPG
jgi:glycosyltransferase involved in cell wall biosynthesis